MTIRYKCAECGAALNIKDELAGTNGHCPRCQVEFVVPSPAGEAVVEKLPAAVASEPPRELKKGPGGEVSEDDIGDFLGAGGSDSSGAGYNVPVVDRGSADDDDEEGEDHEAEEAEKPRKGRRKVRVDDDDVEEEVEDNEDEEDDEDDDSRRRRQKKGQRKKRKKVPAKSDSAESAEIAKSLMARGGERAATAPKEGKKGGRPFGGIDPGEEDRGQGYSIKEVVAYFTSQGLPYLIGAAALIGLCYWLSTLFWKGIDLPPLAAVTGTVTLDGKPIEKAHVLFQPLIEGPKGNLKLGASVGKTDKDGKYHLTYMYVDGKEIQGAVIGKHMVMIRMDDPETGVEKLPLHYTNPAKTILKADVKADMGPLDFPLSSAPEPPPQ